ncbi:MAG: ATP-binding protein [Candidatus Omnitrophica bacterium]|nr:ATP-binding protein [Candidatus Omnitrophota bacterium]
MFRKITATFLTFVFTLTGVLPGGTAYGISVWSGAQRVSVRRDMLSMALEHTRVVYADDDEKRALLEANASQAILLSHGKVLVSADLEGDELGLLRALIHEEIESLMQVLARKDRNRYSGIKELVFKYVPPTPANVAKYFPAHRAGFSRERYLNHVVARVFELILLERGGVMKRTEMKPTEKELINSLEKVIDANKHSYFTGVFWDQYLREIRIRAEIANGITFYQAAGEPGADWPQLPYYFRRLDDGDLLEKIATIQEVDHNLSWERLGGAGNKVLEKIFDVYRTSDEKRLKAACIELLAKWDGGTSEAVRDELIKVTGDPMSPSICRSRAIYGLLLYYDNGGVTRMDDRLLGNIKRAVASGEREVAFSAISFITDLAFKYPMENGPQRAFALSVLTGDPVFIKDLNAAMRSDNLIVREHARKLAFFLGQISIFNLTDRELGMIMFIYPRISEAVIEEIRQNAPWEERSIDEKVERSHDSVQAQSMIETLRNIAASRANQGSMLSDEDMERMNDHLSSRGKYIAPRDLLAKFFDHGKRVVCVGDHSNSNDMHKLVVDVVGLVEVSGVTHVAVPLPQGAEGTLDDLLRGRITAREFGRRLNWSFSLEGEEDVEGAEVIRDMLAPLLGLVTFVLYDNVSDSGILELAMDRKVSRINNVLSEDRRNKIILLTDKFEVSKQRLSSSDGNADYTLVSELLHALGEDVVAAVLEMTEESLGTDQVFSVNNLAEFYSRFLAGVSTAFETTDPAVADIMGKVVFLEDYDHNTLANSLDGIIIRTDRGEDDDEKGDDEGGPSEAITPDLFDETGSPYAPWSYDPSPGVSGPFAIAKGSPATLLRELAGAGVFAPDKRTRKEILDGVTTPRGGNNSESSVDNELRALKTAGILLGNGTDGYYLAERFRDIDVEEFLARNPGLNKASPSEDDIMHAWADARLGVCFEDMERMNASDRKIIMTVKTMMSEGRRVTVNGVGRESGVSKRTVYNRIERNPDIALLIDVSRGLEPASGQYVKVMAALDIISVGEDGLDNKRIAELAGVSPSYLSELKRRYPDLATRINGMLEPEWMKGMGDVAEVTRFKKRGQFSDKESDYLRTMSDKLVEEMMARDADMPRDKAVKLAGIAMSALIRYDTRSLESLSARSIITPTDVAAISGLKSFNAGHFAGTVMEMLDGYDGLGITSDMQERLLTHFYTAEEVSELIGEFDELPDWVVMAACTSNPLRPRTFLKWVLAEKARLVDAFRDIPAADILFACVRHSADPRGFLGAVRRKREEMISSGKFNDLSPTDILFACLHFPKFPENYLEGKRLDRIDAFVAKNREAFSGVDGVISDLDGVDAHHGDGLSDIMISTKNAMLDSGVRGVTLTGRSFRSLATYCGKSTRMGKMSGEGNPYIFMTNSGAAAVQIDRSGDMRALDGYRSSHIGTKDDQELIRDTVVEAMWNVIRTHGLPEDVGTSLIIDAGEKGVTLYTGRMDERLNGFRYEIAAQVREKIGTLQGQGRLLGKIEASASARAVDITAMSKGAAAVRAIKLLGLTKVVLVADSVGTEKDPGNDRSMFLITQDMLIEAGIDWDVELVKVYVGKEKEVELPGGVIVSPRGNKEIDPSLAVYRAITYSRREAKDPDEDMASGVEKIMLNGKVSNRAEAREAIKKIMEDRGIFNALLYDDVLELGMGAGNGLHEKILYPRKRPGIICARMIEPGTLHMLLRVTEDFREIEHWEKNRYRNNYIKLARFLVENGIPADQPLCPHTIAYLEEGQVFMSTPRTVGELAENYFYEEEDEDILTLYPAEDDASGKILYECPETRFSLDDHYYSGVYRRVYDSALEMISDLRDAGHIGQDTMRTALKASPGDKKNGVLGLFLEEVISNAIISVAKRMEIWSGQEGEIRIRAVERDGALWIEVMDNGTGFSAEELGKVGQERFSITGSNDRGHGLLDLARIFRGIGWELDVRNRVDGPGAIVSVVVRERPAGAGDGGFQSLGAAHIDDPVFSGPEDGIQSDVDNGSGAPYMDDPGTFGHASGGMDPEEIEAGIRMFLENEHMLIEMPAEMLYSFMPKGLKETLDRGAVIRIIFDVQEKEVPFFRARRVLMEKFVLCGNSMLEAASMADTVINAAVFQAEHPDLGRKGENAIRELKKDLFAGVPDADRMVREAFRSVRETLEKGEDENAPVLERESTAISLFDKFVSSAGALLNAAHAGYKSRIAEADGVVATVSKNPKSIVLYADDILRHVAVPDLDATVRELVVKHDLLSGGRIILYVEEDTSSADILRKLISRAGFPVFRIKTVTKDDLERRNKNMDTAISQLKSLKDYAGILGAGDVLAVIRGPLSSKDVVENLASISWVLKSPVVVIGSEAGLYSMSEAIKNAIAMKNNKDAQGWLIILDPVRTIAEDIRAMYDEYLGELMALKAA